MKKFMVLCLTLVMIASLSITTLAAPGAFVSSPSGNPAPELVSGVPQTDGCVATIKVTSYADRSALDEATRLALDEAYNQIANATDGNAFYEAVEKLAKDKDMDVSELSVSDLFDIGYADCAAHDGHTGYTITLKIETIESFVGILHMNGDTWEIPEVSEVNEEAGTITFFVDTLSPFAIVVDNGTGEDSSAATYIWIAVVAVVVAAAGAVVAFIFFKKRKV